MRRLLGSISYLVIAACLFVGVALNLTGHDFGRALIGIAAFATLCVLIYERFANRSAKHS